MEFILSSMKGICIGSGSWLVFVCDKIGAVVVNRSFVLVVLMPCHEIVAKLKCKPDSSAKINIK